jgi:hypothetical protein
MRTVRPSPISLSTNFRIRKVHFRMLLHKLLQQLVLLTLVTRRLPLPLHLLVVHHLLHHTPRLAVQLRQLAVLRRDLGRVDLGRGGDDVRPPVRAGGFGKVDGDVFTGRCCFEGPGRVIDLDGVGKVALSREGGNVS